MTATDTRPLDCRAAHEAIRWLTPFIEAALAAGVWPDRADEIRRQVAIGTGNCARTYEAAS